MGRKAVKTSCAATAWADTLSLSWSMADALTTSAGRVHTDSAVVPTCASDNDPDIPARRPLSGHERMEAVPVEPPPSSPTTAPRRKRRPTGALSTQPPPRQRAQTIGLPTKARKRRPPNGFTPQLAIFMLPASWRSRRRSPCVTLLMTGRRGTVLEEIDVYASGAHASLICCRTVSAPPFARPCAHGNALPSRAFLPEARGPAPARPPRHRASPRCLHRRWRPRRSSRARPARCWNR